MIIKVEFLGTDSWDREVYSNVQNGRLYKCSSSDNNILYTTDGFEGEPNYPLREGVKVIIVDRERTAPRLDINGQAIEYWWFDGKERELDKFNIWYVSSFLEMGLNEGEMNQYDSETTEAETVFNGWWRTIQ
ncbi:hypothetical protein [Paenibacillus polymyxa]|uniref:hypothetical protein n=1 Tax=Paenibacillus polymyxa TaxID=1406 RepID=UPI00021BBA87|nr:hypothetical protein [Paenibacillus polymyxa]MDN4106132.1 hypothetical protein [Paenibacillus polymyxa]CCC86403.1 hypothetical protein PPM_p0253 [Paenibacillus polymyxa M1]